MEESLFLSWVKKYFPSIVIQITETLNGEKNALTYLHKSMLMPEYSVDGKWEALSAEYNRVMADVVSMDNSLPLKERDSIGSVTGEIPKMGIELKLNETQLTALDTLVARGAEDRVIVQKLFEDTARVIQAIDERNEAIFLEALSAGVCVVDTNNVGRGIRLDYGYLAANKFESTTPFTDPAATPLTDMQPLLDKADADGNTPAIAMTDKATLQGILKSNEAKELAAYSVGFNGTNLVAPTLEAFNNAISAKYGFVFQEVNRTVKYEKNGVRTSVKPWKTGSIVFLNTTNVGKLVWATLAEMNHPVAGVEYQTANQHTLVSKYRMNKPSLGEFTSAAARVLPVISGVDAIYVLDSTVTEA